MVTYRLASPADAPRLARLRWLHEWEQNPRQPMSEEEFLPLCERFMRRAIREKFYFCFAAVKGEEILANVWLCPIPKIPSPDEAQGKIGYITNVHTLKKYRSSGIGGRLLEQARRFAKEEGCELLFVWPSERSVPFYTRQGFCAENEIMECPLGGE